MNDQCATRPRDTAVARALHAVVASVRPMIILGDHAYAQFYASTEGHDRKQADADAIARKALWSDPILTRALWLRVDSALAQRGLDCEDCPTPPAPGRVELSWDQFRPYLLAYVWPNRVTEDGDIEIAVCSAANGAGALPPTTALRHAGFLAAAAFVTDETRAADIRAIQAAHNSRPGRSLAGMAQAIEAFFDAPENREYACLAVADAAWFTGVVVQDCEGPRPRHQSREPTR